MQRLTVDFIISLDGYGAAEGWPGWWGMESPEYLQWLDQSPEKDHPILMGAKTYRLMASFAASGEPGTEELTAMPKVVFSSTLTEPLDWANTTLVSTDPVAAVRAMKEESDRPLRTLGSVSLCRALLRAGLVDLYRVVIFPVITWRDRRRPDLRRLPRREAPTDEQPHIRGRAAAAGVRADRARGPARCRPARLSEPSQITLPLLSLLCGEAAT